MTHCSSTRSGPAVPIAALAVLERAAAPTAQAQDLTPESAAAMKAASAASFFANAATRRQPSR